MALLVTVGVPEIVPVELSIDRPAGSVGVIDQESTVPPVPEDGVAAVIAESFASVMKVGLYATDDGAISLTWMVNVAVPVPPALVAVTVYDVDGDTADGVPPTAPVELLNVNPAGSAGEIAHEATGPPLEVGETVLIGTPLTSVNELVL
tara:strand:- start:6282 stop:6728 length:447 start_codon:yes stop_codon:yes gene_type:complete